MGLGSERPNPDPQISDAGSESESMDGSSRIAYSGPLSGPLTNGSSHNRRGGRRSARFKDEESYVEITLDVREDSVSVSNVQGADPDMAYLAKALEKKPASLGSQLSFRIRQVSQELRRLASSRRFSKVDRNRSGATRALRGLQFMTDRNVGGGEGWAQVERRFDELAVGGALSRSLFGQCIGMKDSEEFAGELFDALARRRGITASSVSKAELREFWEQISDRGFDSRLQTFFDM